MFLSILIVATPLMPMADMVTSTTPCIAGPHEPLRVRRQPFMPATTSKPRNPLEDAYLHCRTAAERDRAEAS